MTALADPIAAASRTEILAFSRLGIVNAAPRRVELLHIRPRMAVWDLAASPPEVLFKIPESEARVGSARF